MKYVAPALLVLSLLLWSVEAAAPTQLVLSQPLPALAGLFLPAL